MIIYYIRARAHNYFLLCVLDGLGRIMTVSQDSMPLQITKRRYILGYFVASRDRARARARSDEIS